MSLSDTPAAGGGLSVEPAKHSEGVRQSEQLSLTQPGPVLKSAARAHTDASAWTPLVLSRLPQTGSAFASTRRERAASCEH